MKSGRASARNCFWAGFPQSSAGFEAKKSLKTNTYANARDCDAVWKKARNDAGAMMPALAMVGGSSEVSGR